jgi:two-component system cell cycle sensor histidine kinase/response regulator CckA
VRGKSQIPGWAILVIALTIVLIAVISITAIYQSADKSHQAEELLSHLMGQSWHLDALKWQFERRPDPKVMEEVQQVESNIAQTFDELMLLDPGDERLQQLHKAQLEFVTNMDESFRLIAAGDFGKLEVQDTEKTDPSFNRLSDMITNTREVYSERAQQAEREAGIGIALIVISAGMMVGFLILKFQKLQLSAKLIAVEQKALRRSEEQYRNLVELSPEAIGIQEDGKVAYINPAGAKLFGAADPEQLIGKTVIDFVHPDYRKIARERSRRIVEGKVIPPIEEKFIRLDGTVLDIEIAAAPITYHGKTCLQVIFHDITEHKRADAKIHEQAALLDKAQDAILVQDLEGNITYWNKSAERLYGWTAEEVVSKNVNELLYNKESPQPNEAQKSVIEMGEWSGELHHITKDGREITVESRWTLMHDNQGKPKSILIINTDITGKKKLEEQFLRAQRMESIGTLAGGIAHDINNVLAPIMLSLELLKEKFTDNQSQQLIDILDRSAKRGASLIKQVQSFVRGVEGERIPLQTANLISEIRQIAKETFPKSIEIRTDIQKDLWTISGDATQLHQVLMNLCVNARDAMPDGGTLSISAKNIFIDENFANVNIDARVGRYIVIAVSDTGVGIPPKIMDRMFEPFFTTKEHGKGTGLGLSTSLGIVKSHGGFINVYSEVGKGTIFKVYLPVITTTETQKVEELTRELVTGHGELILIVDDEDQIRDITSSTLEKNGYRVLTASNGMEAIALYEQNREEIKLVLMDMMMPVMDGLTGTQKLRKINPELKIIAASGLTEKDKLTKAAGTMNAFLLKPYTTEKLLRTIHEVLSVK